MRVGLRHTPPIGRRWFIAVLTLLIAGCSKPEEVISRRLTQANQNLDAGRVTEAVKILERLNQTYIDQPAVLEALGFAYARGNEHMKAGESFVRAADLDARSTSLRPLAAESFFQAGALERAAQQYRLYLEEFPADYRSREKLGLIEEETGNLVRATDEYLECYRVRPTGETAWRLGNIFRRLNNAPQAKAWFDTTIKYADTRVEDALLGLLELEVAGGDFAAAERTVKQLDNIYPGSLDNNPLSVVRSDLAAWKERQKAVDEARATQERAAREIEEARRRQEAEVAALAAKPAVTPPPATGPATTPPPTTTRPAVATTPVPEPTPAAAPIAPETAPVAVEEAPLANPLPEDMLAAVEAKDRGNLDRAVALLWNILGSDDKRVDAWVELGDCYRLQNKPADAEACLSEATRRAPDNAEVLAAYLRAVRDSQPPGIYFARVESARKKFPGDANLAFLLAHELATMDGATARAVAAYEDFLLLADPQDTRRREASSYLARVRGY